MLCQWASCRASDLPMKINLNGTWIIGAKTQFRREKRGKTEIFGQMLSPFVLNSTVSQIHMESRYTKLGRIHTRRTKKQFNFEG